MALAAAMLVAAGLLCLAGCGGQDAGQKEGGSASANANANGTGTLRVGVRADVVGFGYFNERANNYYGLEIDLARELASRLGYADVEFVTVEPDTRKDMLLDGEVDCLVACYSISDSRTENFDFSPAYYHDRAVIMVENSSLVTDVSALAGKTVGIMSGSNTGPLLAIKLQELGMISEIVENADEGTQYDGLYVKQVPSYAELSRELEEGTVDAAAMDGNITQTYIDEDRSILDLNIADQEYGVATQKGSALSQPVADAIQSMLDDGTIAALTEKWN